MNLFKIKDKHTNKIYEIYAEDIIEALDNTAEMIVTKENSNEVFQTDFKTHKEEVLNDLIDLTNKKTKVLTGEEVQQILKEVDSDLEYLYNEN